MKADDFTHGCRSNLSLVFFSQFSPRHDGDPGFLGSIFQCRGRLVKPHGGGRRPFFVDRSLYIAVKIAPQQLHGSKRADDVHLFLKTPGSQDLDSARVTAGCPQTHLAHLAHGMPGTKNWPSPGDFSVLVRECKGCCEERARSQCQRLPKVNPA